VHVIIASIYKHMFFLEINFLFPEILIEQVNVMEIFYIWILDVLSSNFGYVTAYPVFVSK
jgi:hypothetical protein